MGFFNSGYQVIDRRLILEMFVNTPEGQFKMELWRIPSKSKFYSINMNSIVALGGTETNFITMPTIKVTRRHTMKELAYITLSFYYKGLETIIGMKSQMEKNKMFKESYTNALPIINRRFNELAALKGRWNSKEDDTGTVNINGYQCCTLNI